MPTVRRAAAHFISDIATREGVPLGWLSTLHQRIKTEIPDGEEASCMVHGLQNVTVSWDHTLSDVEQLQATVAEMRDRMAQIKALLPIEGGVFPDEADKLRELLK